MLVAYLGLDACQFCQTCNAVRTTALTLIQKIIMKLPVLVDLAAFLPSLVDELGLANVFLHPSAQRGLQPGIKPAWMDAQTPVHRPH